MPFGKMLDVESGSCVSGFLEIGESLLVYHSGLLLCRFETGCPIIFDSNEVEVSIAANDKAGLYFISDFRCCFG